MADSSSILTTSYITNLVDSYSTSETTKLIDPLTTKRTKYQQLSSAYTSLSSKLTSLKSLLSSLKSTGSGSAFNQKTATTSNNSFINATASNAAAKSSYNLRVNQLAKSDVAISQVLDSDTANAISGTHKFVIKAGDGNGGEYTSHVSVDFTASETNQTVMEKIRDAINSDKAVINSAAKTGTDAYTGGASSFVINVGGTETTVTVNGGGTYSDLIDELVTNINANVDGVTAEKIVDSPDTGNVSLKLTVDDSSKYISISHSSDYNLVQELGIGVTKEKAALGMVTASAFSPSTGNSQFSISSKESGLDYRITSLADEDGYDALSQLGLDIAATRSAFNENQNTAGFMYSDISSAGNQLNSKLTFNGISVQRNTNTITDLASGVTFSLKAVMAAGDTDVNVAVGNDNTAITSKIQSFINQFNDVYSILKSNTSYSSGTRGVFASDSNALSLLSFFKSVAYSEVSGISKDNLKTLSQVGITFDINSGLSISDSSKLTQKLNENIDQVEAIFNSTNGIANVIYNKVNPFLGGTGYLANTKSNYDRNITYLNDKIKNTQTRIDKSAEALRSKYQELQAQYAALLSSQEFISSIVGS